MNKFHSHLHENIFLACLVHFSLGQFGILNNSSEENTGSKSSLDDTSSSGSKSSDILSSDESSETNSNEGDDTSDETHLPKIYVPDPLNKA